MSAYDKFKNLTGAALSAVKDNLHNSVTALSDMKARLDSWSNAMSGLGTNRDRTSYTLPVFDTVLNPLTLEALYHSDDLAARIVSALPDEAFREGFTVVNRSAAAAINEYLQQAPAKPSLKVMRELSKKSMSDTVQEQATELQTLLATLGCNEKCKEAAIWGRLYGVGAVLLGIDDGRETWEPVDVENIRGLHYLTVLDKRDLTPWRWFSDPKEPKFGDVAIYLMQPVGVYVGLGVSNAPANPIQLVHESRMIRFGGELTSKRQRLTNQGADYSVLQKCIRALQLTNDNWQSAAVLLSDASQGVMKIKGLIEMIAQQPDIMQSRFQFMDMARSTTRSIILDADGEDFERKATPFGGIPQMLEQTWKRLASAARMPLTILMGVSPGGLNATGESDIRWWFDSIRAYQEQAVKPQIERLLRLCATAMGYDNTDDWTIVFPPLWQLTAKEQADMHAAQANADKIYLDGGVVTPEEMALSRFGEAKYSLETKIDVESRKRSMMLSLAQMEKEAENELEIAHDPTPTPGVIHAENKALLTTPDPRAPGVTED